jgi:hypothetical protein
MTKPCVERMARMPLTGWNEAANQTMFRRPATRHGDFDMFVRAVWRDKRLVDVRRIPRELDVPTIRNGGILGLCGPDFAKMTRSLFDRQG